MILPNRDALVRVFEDGTSVTICIEIIWCRENSDHGREFLCWGLTEHDIAMVNESATEVESDDCTYPWS